MPWLEEITGVPARRWHDIKKRKVMRTSELEAISKIYPNYSFWLMTGDEMPEAEQISPLTKRTQIDYKEPHKAG